MHAAMQESMASPREASSVRGSEGTEVELVERVIRAVGVLNIDEAERWLADEFVLELPYRGGGYPTVLAGRDARAFMRLLPKLFSRMDFTSISVHGPTTSGLIAAEYESNGLTRAGRPYLNRYAAFFEVGQGRVTRWREYFNPEVLAAAGLG